ncbi:MAG TPA: glycosyl hydrolase [Vicinamibacteria bacterium]|nr:glycosyl hydrolase [Vicinamibacteria bacterium]
MIPPLTRVAAVALLSLAVLPALRTLSATPEATSHTTAAERERSWQRHLELERSSEFRGLPWRAVGPALQGGRIETIAVHPRRRATWLVGVGAGGVWKTENAGLTWTAVFDEQPTFSIGDVAIAPSRPDVVWVGTGEVLMARSSFAGTGVYKSVDGGTSWEAMGLSETHHIAKVVIHPQDPDTVLVAAIGRLYGTSEERGVFRTTDGGRTWRRTLFVDERTGAIDLLMHPRDPQTLFAVMWEHDRRAWNHVSSGPGSGLFKSTDGGLSWNRVAGGLPAGPHVGRMGIAIAPSAPNTLYVLVSNEQPVAEAPPATPAEARALGTDAVRGMSRDDLLKLDDQALERLLRAHGVPRRFDAAAVRRSLEKGGLTAASLAEWLRARGRGRGRTIGGELYRSDAGGASWRRVNQGPIGTAVGYDFCLVEVAPDDPDEVYVLGNHLRRSSDGGKTFSTVGGTIVHLRPSGSRVLHLDHHEMVIDEQDPDRILLGTDGGLYLSQDRGVSWLHVNNLPIAELYAITTDERDPYRVYAGTQDNAALFGVPEEFRFDAPEPWRHVYLDRWGGGDSYFTVPDPDEPDLVYFEHQFGDLRRRRMKTGETASIQPVEEVGEPPLRYNWMTPFVVSRHARRTLYYGANRLLKSPDRGGHWRAISADLTTDPGPERRGNVPYGTLTTISESPLQAGLLLVGSDDGRVHYTPDDGGTWIDVSAGLPGKWVSRVVASAWDPRVFYAALTGYREDDFRTYLFRSADRGRSWTSLAASLPEEPVNVVIEDPRNPSVLYVGTDLGAYVSLDLGTSWQSLSATLPTAAVHDLAVHPGADEIIAGTHGLSAFVLDARPIQGLSAAVRSKAVHLFEPREVHLRRHPADSQPPVQDEDGPARLAFWLKRPGPVTVRIHDAGGRIVRTLQTSGVSGVNAVSWDLRVEEERPTLGDERFRRAPAGAFRVAVEAGGSRAEAPLRLRLVAQ